MAEDQLPAPPAPTIEVCYRHPNVPTRVHCTRCERPICPDCMTSTPVGMRCPECARQTTKVRAGAGAFSPSAAGKMPATIALIAINVIVFVGELASGAGIATRGGGQFISKGALYGPAIADHDEFS